MLLDRPGRPSTTTKELTGDGRMINALAAMTDNRKRIAILALLSFIAMC
jgi:hypothetical protein